MTSDHGTYRLSYTPPESKGNEYYPNITIEMSMDGEASVNHMLRFYEAFLAASGYVLKGELQDAENVTFSENFAPVEFNEGYGTDTISFGAAQPVMQFGFGSPEDVISFG
jgi:hypothetical protein